MSHSSTSLRGATRRRRRARRIGSPPVRRLPRSVRRRSIALARGGPSRGGACAAAASRARGATSAGRAARARPARARRSASGRAAPRRSPARAGPRPRRRPRRRRRRRRGRRRRVPAPLAGGVRSAAGRSSAGAATVARVVALEAPRPRAAAEDREEHRVEHLDMRRIGDEHRAGGPVQPPARDRPHERERRAKSAARAGVTGTPASCRRRLNARRERRQVELDRLDAEGRSVTAAHELLEAGRADHLLVLAVLQHRPERAVHRRDVEALDAEQAQRREPVDRLGDAPAASGRRCRASARRRSRPERRASPTRP